MSKEKVSWNELKIDEMFLASGGLYLKTAEDRAFYFNAHNEIDVKFDSEEDKDKKELMRP